MTWNAVLDLITSISGTTPPPGITPSSDDTPKVGSSSSHQAGEQTQIIIESAMFHEIGIIGHIVISVGFSQKYFEDRPWSLKSKVIYNIEMADEHVLLIYQKKLSYGTGYLISRTSPLRLAEHFKNQSYSRRDSQVDNRKGSS